MGDILSLNAEIDVGGIVAMIDAGNDYIGKEAGMHMNKVGAKKLTLVKRGLSAGWNVPVNLVGALTKLTKATKQKHRIVFRLLLRPIPAPKLGPVSTILGGASRRGRGIRAGNRVYPGAFYARGRGEKWMVFRRRGASRTPLDAMKVPETKLTMKSQALPTMQRHLDDAQQEIADTMPREIVRRMMVARKKREEKVRV